MSKAKKAVKALHEFSKENGHRITAPRDHVLGIIAQSKVPLTAYEVLEALAKKLDAPKPPTAYRALEFLQKHGFIHRIESLNAYVACSENHHHHGSQFMICESCHGVEEIHLCSMPESLQKQAHKKKFTASHWNVEVFGRCGACAKTL